jgi:hypothetical protein
MPDAASKILRENIAPGTAKRYKGGGSAYPEESGLDRISIEESERGTGRGLLPRSWYDFMKGRLFLDGRTGRPAR